MLLKGALPQAQGLPVAGLRGWQVALRVLQVPQLAVAHRQAVQHLRSTTGGSPLDSAQCIMRTASVSTSLTEFRCYFKNLAWEGLHATDLFAHLRAVLQVRDALLVVLCGRGAVPHALVAGALP